jgi:hypothetical protein
LAVAQTGAEQSTPHPVGLHIDVDPSAFGKMDARG